uniref:Uncharacterized protein n=1 Tax=Panagrolaimus sp. ES5 TaxID=591445 RepID=A0AC34GEB2_9BILA
MVDKGKIFKVVCIFLFVLTAIFIISSFTSDWRATFVEHWRYYDLFGGVSTVFSTDQAKLDEEIEADKKAGKSYGWTGDKAVAALFILAFILYLINILICVISTVAANFPAKVSFIHPIICFIATFFMIIACIVFGVNKTDLWLWCDHKITGSNTVNNKTTTYTKCEQGYNDVDLKGK